jgi:hypothetical protein
MRLEITEKSKMNVRDVPTIDVVNIRTFDSERMTGFSYEPSSGYVHLIFDDGKWCEPIVVDPDSIERIFIKRV